MRLFLQAIYNFNDFTAKICTIGIRNRFRLFELTLVRVPFGGLVAISVEHPRQDYSGTRNYFETRMTKMCLDNPAIV